MLWVMLVLTAITAVQRFVKVWRQAAVAPVTAARIEMRRSRRQTRRVVRTERRHTRDLPSWPPSLSARDGDLNRGRQRVRRARRRLAGAATRQHVPTRLARRAADARAARRGCRASIGFGASFASPAERGDDRTPPAPCQSDDARQRAARRRAAGLRLLRPLLRRELPAADDVERGRRQAVHHRGLATGARRVAGGQRGDPRPAAPRRAGSGPADG